MSERYVTMLINNQREPKLRTLLRFERALELESGELSRKADAYMPAAWARSSEEDKSPKKRGRSKKSKD